MNEHESVDSFSSPTIKELRKLRLEISNSPKFVDAISQTHNNPNTLKDKSDFSRLKENDSVGIEGQERIRKAQQLKTLIHQRKQRLLEIQGFIQDAKSERIEIQQEIDRLKLIRNELRNDVINHGEKSTILDNDIPKRDSHSISDNHTFIKGSKTLEGIDTIFSPVPFGPKPRFFSPSRTS
ncbi:hypothetical protein ROZALSC1DRAFT_31574 [Rozella allomycis CSF55]|uniref:Uncharacterized protein n=1 Tax=Rozella allomycis (strain CSF55) TaxID=988480 RepID=A0A4P9YB77_ROZAC|nr:hypothetical protein ROZALSC1DRAFT_31574 [Rozella allomycis CSF55]